VPSSPADTWEHFRDLGSLAECFPGAAVTSVEGDDFEGTVKVKLGPIALVYGGSGHFVERDEDARRFVVEAKGKDKRGNGTASATVTASMVEEGTGTQVSVLTELQVTGKPAQFGRGVMQDVSDKLLQQFVTCLEARVAAPAPEEESGPEEGAAEAEPSASPRATPRLAPAPPPRQADEGLDLMRTVLPIIIKGHWRELAAGLAGLVGVVLVLKRLFRRH